MSAFPQNHWYVAAWSHEVGRSLLARTICNEPVVFYRTAAGEPVALADRCVHRRYPLSLGKLVEDEVECGYHGFKFDCAGACTFVPGQDRIPRTARVPRYTLVERHSWIWIWIGDREPDLAAVPDAHWLDDPAWGAVRDLTYSPFRHSLLMDNLMDLSHETYLHAGLIGTPEIARTPFTTTVDEQNHLVRFSRHMSAVECPPFYAKSTGFRSPIDRWQDVYFEPPSFWVNNVRVAPHGVEPGPNGDDSGAAHVKILHGLTPETEHSTWDFWAVVRDFALDDDSVGDFLLAMNQDVVQQDLDALTVLEQVVATEPPGTQELSVAIDAGGLAARDMMRRLLS